MRCCLWSSGACTGSERGSLRRTSDQPRCRLQPQEMERDEVPKPHRLMLPWNGVKFTLPHDAMGESVFGALSQGRAMDQPNFAGDYDVLLDLVKSRASVRKLKPDAIPDDYVTQILEVGRWAMSGANGQPWDFIVVKHPDTKKALFRAYIEENNDFIYWMEQQRDFKLRHPSFQMTHDEALQKHRNEVG